MPVEKNTIAEGGLCRIRRIALVGHDNSGSSRLFEILYDAFPGCDFLLVEGLGLYYKKSFAASVIKLLKEASWLFVFVRFIELVKHKLAGRTLSKLARERNVPVITTRDINSDTTIKQLEDFAPDLLVSLFTMQIYKNRAINLPKYGAITSHPSILPNYRGLEVFFWVLANEEAETGVSVFFLSEKIDDGDVIWQQPIPIEASTTVASLYETITEVGGRGLVESIIAIDGERASPMKLDGGQGSYFSMPDRQAVRRFLRSGRHFF